MSVLSESQIKFLRELANWSGVASPQDLGPQTSQQQNSARQRSKRQGLVEFDGGYWRMTQQGWAAFRGEVE